MRTSSKLFVAFLMILGLSATAQSPEEKAQQLILQTEEAMGGQEAFDKIRHINWNFFGARILTWDKYTGDVRIDFQKENSIYLFNINTPGGQFLKEGVEVKDTKEKEDLYKKAREIWINDSYWLIMPFKMNDSGVSTTYMGQLNSPLNELSDVIQMTFAPTAGVTPDNKYLVYLNPETHLVSAWSYFQSQKDEVPRFTMPWLEYKNYNGVLISADRGERKLSPVHVYSKLSKKIYTTFDKPKIF